MSDALIVTAPQSPNMEPKTPPLRNQTFMTTWLPAASLHKNTLPLVPNLPFLRNKPPPHTAASHDLAVSSPFFFPEATAATRKLLSEESSGWRLQPRSRSVGLKNHNPQWPNCHQLPNNQQSSTTSNHHLSPNYQPPAITTPNRLITTQLTLGMASPWGPLAFWRTTISSQEWPCSKGRVVLRYWTTGWSPQWLRWVV